MATLPKVKIFSDGSARGNPDGPGGYGTIVQYMTDDNKTSKVMEYTDGFKVTTNNRMELMGVIIGLESLSEPHEVMIYSDSKYVVDAFNQKWIDKWLKNNWKTSAGLPVKNIDLWKRLLKAKESHDCKFAWVQGHNGHPDNERCDYLATASADGIIFNRKEDGRLEEVKKELSTDAGMTDGDKEVPKFTMNEVMRDYIAKMNKEQNKDCTVKINGVRFIIDEEGNVAPHPDEDIEKCKKVYELFNDKFADMLDSLFLFSSTISIPNGFMDGIFEKFFTGDRTIPSIDIEKP